MELHIVSYTQLVDLEHDELHETEECKTQS
jgi:hypothetical protein